MGYTTQYVGASHNPLHEFQLLRLFQVNVALHTVKVTRKLRILQSIGVITPKSSKIGPFEYWNILKHFEPMVTWWSPTNKTKQYIYIYILLGFSVSLSTINWSLFRSGWWFQTFYIFHNIWENPSHWLIFFKMVKTTNQRWWPRLKEMNVPRCSEGANCGLFRYFRSLRQKLTIYRHL